jgi:hypothetical protein
MVLSSLKDKKLFENMFTCMTRSTAASDMKDKMAPKAIEDDSRTEKKKKLKLQSVLRKDG